MRDGDQVTVRAQCAMPGVPDGAVQHVQWGPRLAALVAAGRYEVLEHRPATAAAEASPKAAEAKTGEDDEEPRPRPRRSRSR